ncbi:MULTISPECIES: hypothetical protein [Acidobacterium]|nr:MULTISPECIES: hypothetical protein [Acidobacterium]HCT60904.1 hypothetical protein [Acidobacterium sp.]
MLAEEPPDQAKKQERMLLLSQSLTENPPQIGMPGTIAAGISLSLWLWADEYRLPGAIMLICSIAALIWNYWIEVERDRNEARRGRLLSFSSLAFLTVLLSCGVLLFGVLHRHPHVASGYAGAHPAHNRGGTGQNADTGYAGIILWPRIPRKVKIVPPPPLAEKPEVARIHRPLVIPFDGAYWYFNAPATRPGPKAHTAHGSPSHADIHANNRLHLIMEAHQTLGRPIKLTCCGEMDLLIDNHDNVPGAVRIAVELIDTSSPNPRSLDLGSRAVLSSEPPEFSLNRPAVTEVLRYTIPSDSSLHQFNEIEVVFLPAEERDLGGSRIDIQEFTLLSR